MKKTIRTIIVFTSLFFPIHAHADCSDIAGLGQRAQRGNANAQTILGDCYRLGDGVPQSDELAAQWYSQAARQGFPPAEFILGSQFALGKGVPKDRVLGYFWLSLSARDHNPMWQPWTGSAQDDINALRAAMTPEQIAAAEKMLQEVGQKQ